MNKKQLMYFQKEFYFFSKTLLQQQPKNYLYVFTPKRSQLQQQQ